MDSIGLEFQNDMEDVGNVIQNLNDDSSNETQYILPEFGMYPVYDSSNYTIADGVENNDVASVDDWNNVSKSDLLFLNTDSFENILADSDLLNAVSESTNFYNETLYDNGTSKESSTVDCSVNMSGPILDTICHQTENCNIPMETTDPEIVLRTENLENIVPNLNEFTNVSNCDVYSDGYNLNNFLLLPDYKTGADSNLLTSKHLENEKTKIKNMKIAATGVVSVVEVINCKGSNFFLNNNNLNVVKNKYNDFVLNGTPKEVSRAKTSPLKTAKAISPQVLNLLTNDVNYRVPAKLLKNMNGLPTTKLCVNKLELKNKPSEFITKISTKSVGCESSKDMSKPMIHTISQSDKSVQTTSKEDTHNCQLCMKFSTLDEEINKPILLNNSYVFHFSISIKLSIESLTDREFHKNDEKIRYYTGIPKYSYFIALLNCLNIPRSNVVHSCDMLLLTLMKLRLNLNWTDLAYRFNISVPVVREAFGFTIFLLLNCLSHLIHWPMLECSSRNGSIRTGTCLYFLGIKMNFNNCSHSKMNRRLFICLSHAKHPVHFVSEPIAEDECKGKLQMLAASGIRDSLVLRDVIAFDDNIDCPSVTGDRTVLLAISKKGKSFSNKPYNDYLPQIEKMKKIVSEIGSYKFLYERIKCCWVNEPKDEFVLFNDIVKVVCCLVNLCHVLPFCSAAVKQIRLARKDMEIIFT